MSRKRYKISTARILQISNDISENMCIASAEELQEVVLYFRDQFDALFNKRAAERGSLALRILKLATPLLGRRTKSSAAGAEEHRP